MVVENFLLNESRGNEFDENKLSTYSKRYKLKWNYVIDRTPSDTFGK